MLTQLWCIHYTFNPHRPLDVFVMRPWVLRCPVRSRFFARSSYFVIDNISEDSQPELSHEIFWLILQIIRIDSFRQAQHEQACRDSAAPEPVSFFFISPSTIYSYRQLCRHQKPALGQVDGKVDGSGLAWSNDYKHRINCFTHLRQSRKKIVRVWSRFPDDRCQPEESWFIAFYSSCTRGVGVRIPDLPMSVWLLPRRQKYERVECKTCRQTTLSESQCIMQLPIKPDHSRACRYLTTPQL